MLVGAAALFVAASTITRTSDGADHQNAVTDTPSVTPTTPTRPSSAVPHSRATRKAPSKPVQRTASSAKPARTTASPNHSPPQTFADGFSLVVQTQSGDVSANVDSISVASNEPVDPPHNTAEQWNTAVWVRQSSYPSASSNGTSYVYGHACHHHVCSFTRLKNAHVGDHVIVTTAAGRLIYRIEKIGLSRKSARSLPSWASDSTVPNRLVLVTCAYEQGDTSNENIVVVSQLRGA